MDEREKKKAIELLREMRQGGGESGENASNEKRLTWMYKGPSDMVDREEYLLGKAIDKSFETQKNGDSSDLIGRSYEPSNVPKRLLSKPESTEQVDIAKKILEDPLYAIKQKEMEARRKLLDNPVKMKELKKMIMQRNMEKLKRKQEKRKKKQRKKDEKKLDKLILKKLQIFSQEQRIKLLKRAALSSESESEIEKHGKGRKKKRKKLKRQESSEESSESKSSDESGDSEDMKRKKRKSGESKEKRRKKDSVKEKSWKSPSKKDSLGRERDQKRKRSHRRSEEEKSLKSRARKISESSTSSESTSSSESESSSESPSSGKSGCSEKRGGKDLLKESKLKKSSNDWGRKSKMDRSKVKEKRSKRHRSDSSSLSSSSDSDDRRKRSRGTRNVRNRPRTEHRQDRRQERDYRGKPEPAIKPKQLSEKEREAMLKEMMADARVRKEEREKNLEKHRKVQSEEEKLKDYDDGFMRRQISIATSQGTMADRIRSNVNNIQRSKADMDKSFVRK